MKTPILPSVSLVNLAQLIALKAIKQGQSRSIVVQPSSSSE